LQGDWSSDVCSSDLGPQGPGKSKLARPLLRPSFDYNFLFGVELDRVAPLAMHNSEETFLPTAERKVGHWCSHPDVDANIAGLHFVTEFARRRAAAREDRGSVTVETSGQNLKRFLHRLSV